MLKGGAKHPSWKPKWTCIANPKGIAHENYKNNKASAKNTAIFPNAQCMVKISPTCGSSFGV